MITPRGSVNEEGRSAKEKKKDGNTVATTESLALRHQQKKLRRSNSGERGNPKSMCHKTQRNLLHMKGVRRARPKQKLKKANMNFLQNRSNG